jgi:hypothetical protein
MRNYLLILLLALFGAGPVFGQAKFVKVSDTIATLKQESVSDTHLAILVQGSATKGDGGDAIYYWSAASAATPDDDEVVLSNRSATGRWLKFDNLGGSGGGGSANALLAASPAILSGQVWVAGGANRSAVASGIAVTGGSLEILGAGALTAYLGYIDLTEQASMSNPDAGVWRIWQSDDGSVYLRDSSGNDTALNGGGSQTPWTQNINGGGYNLSAVNEFSTTNMFIETLYLSGLTSGSLLKVAGSGTNIYVTNAVEGVDYVSPSNPTLTSAIVTYNGADGGLTDDTYDGVTITGRNAGETVAQWELVRFHTDSEFHLADANAAGEYPARGIAVAASTDGNTITVLVQGIIRNDGWAWGTIGGPIYLSETAGALTQTAPSTSGSAVQIVGWALSADVIWFGPDSTTLVVQ